MRPLFVTPCSRKGPRGRHQAKNNVKYATICGEDAEIGDDFVEGTGMSHDTFFAESREPSRVKAEIVAKYFFAWAKVVVPATRGQGINKIAYIDLFAGPGRYDDGAKSTPLLVLERAAADPVLSKMLVSLFNDRDPGSVGALRSTLDSIPELASLTHKPQVFNDEVGTQIVARFEKMRMVPTFFFVDPWGYKGLSLRLINSVLKDWGCDCTFFFNYNRVNMGLSNHMVRSHMEALFGAPLAGELRTRIAKMDSGEREAAIVESLAEALKEMGGEYILPFRFKNKKGRTSHHLVFVSKHFKGYEIMKDVMASESSAAPQGVPSFEYDPASSEPLLFSRQHTLEDLKKGLLEHFAGRRLTMYQVYEEHSAGRPFIKKNYKQALMELEEDGQISARPPATDRRKRTFADRVLVDFPEGSPIPGEPMVPHAKAG